MDTTSRLLMLLEVVEQGSFTKAADHRNIDRSVISKQINRLEDELGVRLLNRTTRSFSLTAAGAEMLRKAKELRDLLGETVRLAENYHKEARGLLKITAPNVIAKHYLIHVINDFQKRFPQVEIELQLSDSYIDLVAEGMDLAFRIGEPKDSSLIARKIARNRSVIVASPEFIDTYGMPNSIEELVKLPASIFASFAVKHDTIRYIDEQGNHNEQKIKSVFSVNDPDVLLKKTLSGATFLFIPAFIITNEINDGLLVPLLPDLKLKNLNDIYAIYPHRDLPVRTRLFFDAVRDYLGKDVPIWESNIPGFEHLYQGGAVKK
ncbi:LysR family transcriptional regulator [Psychromonas sp. PT13]|uniref:LysR family transcriptional regulator n=1 Tax=Psychromonas sp. PT13 TaxID=3439547 RepID=UPI003EBFF3B8